jgi:hypothetical protein
VISAIPGIDTKGEPEERYTYSRRRIQASVAQPQIGGR